MFDWFFRVSKASATCDQVQSSSKSKDTQVQLYTNTPTIMCIYLLTPQTVQFGSRLGCHMKGNCPKLPSTGHELHHWTHSSNCCMTRWSRKSRKRKKKEEQGRE